MKKSNNNCAYIDLFLNFICARDAGRKDLAENYLNRFFEWSVIQNRLDSKVNINYKRYGMMMCGPLYAVVSKDTFRKEMAKMVKENFWKYKTSSIEKDEDRLTEILNKMGRVYFSAEMTKKISDFVERSAKNAWNVLMVRYIKPFYPRLTEAYLKNYITLRLCGMDFDNSDEEWLNAVNGDIKRRNDNDPVKKRSYWTIRKCYNLRRAFLPEGVELENEAYYKSIYYGCKNFLRVNDFQKTHSSGNIYQCSKELDLSLDLVKKYWNEDISASGYVKGGEKCAYKIARVLRWRKEHPDGTVEQCSDALGHSISVVYNVWENDMADEVINTLLGNENQCMPETATKTAHKLTRSSAIVFLWKNRHPEGTIKQCALEVELSIPTVKKFWDSSFDVMEAEKIASRVSKKNAPKNAVKISAWYQAHLDGTPEDCARELGISRSTAYDYWPQIMA